MERRKVTIDGDEMPIERTKSLTSIPSRPHRPWENGRTPGLQPNRKTPGEWHPSSVCGGSEGGSQEGIRKKQNAC